MTFQARRELLMQVGPRYREAPRRYKQQILDEFVAVTGYHRKYAIRVLLRPTVAVPGPLTRPRVRRYGPAVVTALEVAWAATNYVCAKRLVPFLPELIPALERHGHLTLTPEVRADLLTVSAATADRLLRSTRDREHPRGRGTTKAGSLLKRHVPIRTFAGWDDAQVGFMEMEADTVAHCGNSTEGAYLSSLVLTDVATGWTECLVLAIYLIRLPDEVNSQDSPDSRARCSQSNSNDTAAEPALRPHRQGVRTDKRARTRAQGQRSGVNRWRATCRESLRAWFGGGRQKRTGIRTSLAA